MTTFKVQTGKPTCNNANIEIKDKINQSHGFINYQLPQYL